MADDELKKLKRADLLNRLLVATRENERLKAELAEARMQLADRQLNLLDAGSIAEASLKVNEVFTAAQAAADQYLDNIERLYRGRGELVREAQSKAQALVAQAKLDAQAQVEQVRADAESQAQQVRAAASVAADEARVQARAAQLEADEAKRAAIRAKDEAAEIVRQAQDQAREILDEAKAEAGQEAERIVAEARVTAQLRMEETERVCRNFEKATKVKCDNAMRRAVDEAHTYGSTMRMAMHALGITPEMVPALEDATGLKVEQGRPASAAQPAADAADPDVSDAVSQLDEAVSNARAAVAAALSNAKTPPGTLDDDNVAAMYPNSVEQL